MIELIYNEEEDTLQEEKDVKLPKNIRQIGELQENRKIFMEDFVHTFLQQCALEGGEQPRIAVLLGESEKSGKITYLFVKGALELRRVEESRGKYLFTEEDWADIYRRMKELFENQEILGWFLSKPGFPVEKDSFVEETQRTYFSGPDKIFFMMDPLENEEGIFGYERAELKRQRGFCIYYEKNESMRSYIMSKNQRQEPTIATEKPDRAIENFRKILKEKQERSVKHRRTAVTYGAGLCAALILLVGGVAVLDAGRNALQVQKTLPDGALADAASEKVVVESIAGEVEESLPQEEPTAETAEAPEAPVEEAAADEEAVETVEDAPETSSEEAKAAPQTYLVQKGDTLAAICRTIYGTDERISEICELNQIDDQDYIWEGETILLP